ncbi:hypothetical protein [Puia sp.]|uniref:hypothetical protein n=1 Tax=Puia sp. TaxID=2045100 RepID=UPI002F4263B2
MKHLLVALLLSSAVMAMAQTRREDIHTDFVLYNKRVALENDLRDRVVARHFAAPLDSNTEDGYLSGCWAVAQFLFDGPAVMQGFDHLFAGYKSLSYDTKRALLEAVYAVAPDRYRQEVNAVMAQEADARLFALCTVYLFRLDMGVENANGLKIGMVERFPGYDTIPVLQELQHYLSFTRKKTPAIAELFAYQQKTGAKTIYSFQRWDRDFGGLAIVQNADGRFVRDENGRLQVFQQLARSGPGLPYFLTNGNTPQGVYSIQGTDISRTNFIGPTPNLQLLLPGEGKWKDYFHDPDSVGGDSLQRYRELLPPGWRDYTPMMEAWSAGAIGRTEIIAHGTTIDPEYFKGRPFYPLTPTMGCLCAKELWNPTTGHLLVSEQNNLVNAFLSTPGRKGFLIVVNLDDQRKAVSREEVERLIDKNPRR